MLIKAGSEGYHSPVMTGGGRDKRRKGREKEGKGGEFLLWTAVALAQLVP